MQAQTASPVRTRLVDDSKSEEPGYLPRVFVGDKIAPYVNELAKMQELYERPPYYCQANFAQDLAHILRFRDNPNSVVCLAFDNGKVIGAVMGRPQVDVRCVNDAFPDERSVFHLSHCLVLPQYYSPKLLESLYSAFEGHIKESPHYDRISCALVARPADFRLPVPPNPELFDAQLGNFGFKQVHSNQPFFFEWTLTDERDDSKHPMILWTKNIK